MLFFSVLFLFFTVQVNAASVTVDIAMGKYYAKLLEGNESRSCPIRCRLSDGWKVDKTTKPSISEKRSELSSRIRKFVFRYDLSVQTFFLRRVQNEKPVRFSLELFPSSKHMGGFIDFPCISLWYYPQSHYFHEEKSWMGKGVDKKISASPCMPILLVEEWEPYLSHFTKCFSLLSGGELCDGCSQKKRYDTIANYIPIETHKVYCLDCEKDDWLIKIRLGFRMKSTHDFAKETFINEQALKVIEARTKIPEGKRVKGTGGGPFADYETAETERGDKKDRCDEFRKRVQMDEKPDSRPIFGRFK